MFSFLDLPVEVRLQIYEDVLNVNSIRHSHLALQPKDELDCPQYLQSVGKTNPTSTVIQRQKSQFNSIGISMLTPSSNPQSLQRNNCGKIPTALLTSCRQIYQECHHLPWETNHFTFINWFWSGIYAARQFSRSLESWQAQSLRYVGIEVLTRDLRNGDATHVYGATSQSTAEAGVSRSEWEEICNVWQGVWGVRLAIKGNVKSKSGARYDHAGIYIRPEEQVYAAMMMGIQSIAEDKGVLDIDASWVKRGLCDMKSLKWLEIGIHDEVITKQEKMKFCEELARVLSRGREEDVKVMLVEMIEAVPIPNKDFRWIGGPPGDDSIDGS